MTRKYLDYDGLKQVFKKVDEKDSRLEGDVTLVLNGMYQSLNDKADKESTYDKETIDKKIADAISGGEIDLDGYLTKTEAEGTYALKSELDGKQNALNGKYVSTIGADADFNMINVSFANFDGSPMGGSREEISFKTINGENILGEGDISIQGGSDNKELEELAKYFRHQENSTEVKGTNGFIVADKSVTPYTRSIIEAEACSTYDCAKEYVFEGCNGTLYISDNYNQTIAYSEGTSLVFNWQSYVDNYEFNNCEIYLNGVKVKERDTNSFNFTIKKGDKLRFVDELFGWQTGLFQFQYDGEQPMMTYYDVVQTQVNTAFNVEFNNKTYPIPIQLKTINNTSLVGTGNIAFDKAYIIPGTPNYSLYNSRVSTKDSTKGYASLNLGNGTETYSFTESALGNYNKSLDVVKTSFDGSSSIVLFSIGNGRSNSIRHNAFEVRANGDIYIPDTSAEGTYSEKPMIHLQEKLKSIPDTSSFATTEYVDSQLGDINNILENILG